MERISEEILQTLTVEDDNFIGYQLVEPIESPIFATAGQCIKWFNSLKTVTKYTSKDDFLILEYIIASHDTDYDSDEVFVKGEIMYKEEYLIFDKQYKNWKK